MSDLQFNKIAGAVLATGLAIVGLNIVSEGLFTPDKAEKPGYAIEVAEAVEGGDAGPSGPPDWGTVLPAANVAMGATVSKKCVSCHNFEKGGANGTGPNLWSVIGRDAGTHPGFAYSPAMVAHGAWDYDALDAFLAAPQRTVEGTKMSFVGLKKQEDRIALIAYLRSMADAPPAIPAPDPSRAPNGAEVAAAPAPGAGPLPTQDNNSTSLEGAEGTAGLVAGASTDREAAGGAARSGGVAGQAPSSGIGQAANQDRSNPGGTGEGPTGQGGVQQSGQGGGQSTKGGQSN